MQTFFDLNQLVHLFLPVLKFLKTAIEWFTIGIWDAITQVLDLLPFEGGIIAQIVERIASFTQLPAFLNQYNLLTFTIGFGIVFVIVITIIQFIGDTIGL